jgi:ankyrin repeat protein
MSKFESNLKAFRQACQYGYEVEVIEHLERQMTDVHKSLYGDQGMYQACLHGQTKIVDLLERTRELRILYGSSIWFHGFIGACASRNAILAKRMLDNGANDYNECRALHLVCKLGHVEVIELMLKRKPKTLKWAMQGACESGNMSIVKLIFNHGVEDWDGVMQSAGKSGSMDIIEFLIDVGLTDWKGGLVGGCYSGNMDIVKLMLKHGIEGSDLNYRLGLVNACRGGHLEIVKLMLGFKIRDYHSALKSACFNGNMEIIELILDRCSRQAGNTNTFNGNLQSGLAYACMGRQLDVIVYMIKIGAVVTDRRIEISRDPEVVELLKAAKENPNCLTLVKPIRS